jgi:hypothetical protein
MMQILAAGRLKLGDLISTKLPISEWQNAFELCQSRQALKVLMYPIDWLNRVILEGSGVCNYHFAQSNLNSRFAEHLSVGDGTGVRPIFEATIAEPLPVNGHVTLGPAEAGPAGILLRLCRLRFALIGKQSKEG